MAHKIIAVVLVHQTAAEALQWNIPASSHRKHHGCLVFCAIIKNAGISLSLEVNDVNISETP